MNDSQVNAFGHVGIQPMGSLADTAKHLGEALGGLAFVEDDRGRYDEYPAYIAERNGLRYALLGVPAPEDDVRDNPSDDFTLMIEPLTPQGGVPDADVSEETIKRIRSDGRLTCWALT
ncbi:MAG: hypothetical protein IV097_15405 [Burkholderiaceae bacterium]|nr:hypothetical protein [Burkholderiaceae bacterium]